MKKNTIEHIIVKYLNKEASEDELITLDLWLRNEENIKTFNQFAKTQFIITSSMEEFDLEKAKQNVKKKLKTNLRVKRLKQFSKYAAAVLVAGLISIPFLTNKSTPNEEIDEVIVSEEVIKTGSNKAVLTLNDGKEVELNKGEAYNTNYTKSDGENLIYNTTDTPEIAFNYLTVPRGGQYFVQLSDGTKVWLNSDSKIKYPVGFTKGDLRKIELVYGEVYLEVSPSTKHEGSKFMVHSKFQDIEVLGTKFNIKAYQDEENIYTTLIEGSVAVSTKLDRKLLSPNYQSIININSQKIAISEANISEAIAWKNGIFSFKNLPLKDMMTTLSRWYDTKVDYSNKDIENIKFTGVLGKDQNIEDILSIITNSNGITYEVKNNTIFFK